MSSVRADDLRTGVRLELLTVIWMVIEAAISLGAGIVAGSVLLIAFGLDSVIELVSGSVLLWRLSIELHDGEEDKAEQVEHTATWVIALTLGLLCVYVLVSSVLGLVTRASQQTSPVGIAVSLAAVIVMPYLAWRKRTVAQRIGSEALEGDAAESITCAYMAGTVLVGLVLNAIFGWWWAEYAAALAFLVWLGRETREAYQEAREGKREHSGAET